MKLKKVYIENFRGYYGENEIDFEDNINIIIGKNDVGKSTILEALEIFFNDQKPENDDLNKKASKGNGNISISCEFDINEEEKNIVIDSTHPINLAEEYLLTENQTLKIKKVFNSNDGKVSGTPKKYICCNYPDKYAQTPLVLRKISALKTELESNKNQIEDYENINKTISGEIRKALYNLFNKELTNVEIDMTKEDMKDISEKINDWLPLYFVFKSDRKNTDKDSEVQNPLQIAMKSFMKEENIQNKLKEIEDEVREYISKIGEETIEKFNEMNSELNINLSTSLEKKPWESIFGFSIVGDDEIPLNKRGSGFRRLILLSYFRAESERILKNKNSNNIIYAIEEPETSQHPNFQKMIIETLEQISENEKYQILITTHTPEMVKLIDLNNIILLEKDICGNININKGVLTPQKVADTLGMLPYLLNKVIVCVEGENDINFLNNIGKIEELKNIIDISTITIIPMSGSNLLKWVRENYLEDSNIREVHIYDGDKKEYIDIVNKINSEGGRKYGFNTKCLEMENYIPYKYIEEEFNIKLDKKIIEDWDKEDIPKYLANKVKQEILNFEDREKIIKQILNGRIAKKITYKDLENNNKSEEIKIWFEKIKEFKST